MLSSMDLKHNMVKVTPQNRNDLFILNELITPDSLVTARSPRSIKVRRGDRMERAKTGRKEVLMKVVVEKTEIKEHLRLTGKILEAPDIVDKGYHTIDVEPGKLLTIEKEWRSWEIDRLKAAEIKSEPVLVCVLDDEEADFYFLKERYKHLLSMRSEVSGKAFDTRNAENKRKEYYENLIKKLKVKSSNVKKIIIAGPGFTKEDLQNVIKAKEKNMLEKIMVKPTYQTGKLGLQELLRQGLLEKLGKMSRVEEESKAVEAIIEGIGKGKTIQGIDVKDAIEAGKVSMLLVSDNKIRDYEELLNLADEMKAKIMIISSNHPAGERLLDLGGIAALLS
ncbi:MAG: mRNA surveillance protein pelota [Candidatus Aenigmatarchaeota archaeon]